MYRAKICGIRREDIDVHQEGLSLLRATPSRHAHPAQGPSPFLRGDDRTALDILELLYPPQRERESARRVPRNSSRQYPFIHAPKDRDRRITHLPAFDL